MKNYFQQVIYAFLSSTLFFKNDFKKVQIYDRRSKSINNFILSLTWAWNYLNPSFSYSMKIISEVSLWNSLSPEILICLLKDFYNLATCFISEVTSQYFILWAFCWILNTSVAKPGMSTWLLPSKMLEILQSCIVVYGDNERSSNVP